MVIEIVIVSVSVILLCSCGDRNIVKDAEYMNFIYCKQESSGIRESASKLERTGKLERDANEKALAN